MPASLRGYPFTLANTEDGQKALCPDQAHLTNDQGEPLFDEDGNLTQKVAQTLDFFLKQCGQNREVTAASTQKFHEAGVIEPWPLTLECGEAQEPLKVNGLYRFNEKALNALDADTFATLRGDPMALAHAQLFSMSQLNQLTERAKLHAKHATQEIPENLDSVQDGMDDDELTFDFDS